MAPTESGYRIPISKTSVIVIIAAAAIVWLMLSNMPPAPPPKEQPRVIKVNATPPPPQPQPQPQSAVGLFMCRGEAYMTKKGVMICGVEMVTDQYVFIRRGWIYAPNSTQFIIVGDVSACRLSVGVNMLYLNCTNYIMVARQ
jgi:hypothetical protein